jgi:hypothetical protein
MRAFWQRLGGEQAAPGESTERSERANRLESTEPMERT